MARATRQSAAKGYVEQIVRRLENAQWLVKQAGGTF